MPVIIRLTRTVIPLILAAATCAAQATGPKPNTPKANTPKANTPQPSTDDVNVVNTPTVNVGTMPAVTVSGTPTVNIATLPAVTIGGTPTVNVGNLPAVNIGNSPTVQVGNSKTNPANALDVERAARIPYESTQNLPGCTPAAGCSATFPAAPAGYRIVLQHVSASMYMALGTAQPPFMYVLPSDHPPTRAFLVGKLGPNVNSVTYGVINEDVLSYFDPADGAPFVAALGNFFSPAFANYVTLSGYLENCAVTGCPPVQR